MRFILMFAVLALAVALVAEAAQLHKCVDGSGRVTYSDKACQHEPRPSVSANAGQQRVNKAINGKLNEALVTKVLLHASDLGVQSDYQAQCALAAKDIVFKITDETVASARVVAGRRAQICALQQDSATAIEDGGLKVAVKHGAHQISLNADSTQATAKFRSTTTFTLQGRRMMSTECEREETLAVYGDLVLYANVLATCKTRP